MPSEKWDEIVTRYEEVYLHSRYEENAKGILNLLPRIKDDQIFVDVVLTTSLTALCLGVPGKKARALIWYENGVYSVSVQGDSSNEEKWTEVSDENIVSVLQQHIREISSK
jgi:hypothetical protein